MILAWTVLEKFHPEPSEAAFSTVFPYNFQPEVDNDVISGKAVDNVGMDVPIKFGDSRLNGFQNIRGADFVSNERTLAQSYPNSAKRKAFRLKTWKLPSPTPWWRISWERLNPVTRIFFYIVNGDKCAHILSDMTSLVPSDRLQHVIEHCPKVRKTGLASKVLNNSVMFDARSPIKRRRMSANIFKFSYGALRLAPPVGGLIVIQET